MNKAHHHLAVFGVFAVLSACGSDEDSGARGGSGAGGKAGSSSGTGGSGGVGGSTGGVGGVGGGSGSGGGSGAGAGAGGTGGSVPVGGCGTDANAPKRSFCDPATWGGKALSAATDVVVSGDVIVDCNAEVKSIEVPQGATLRASRTKASTLTIHGNLVVQGRLDYGTPDDRVCGVNAEIVFQGMNDQNYVGTPSPTVQNGGTPGVFPKPLDVPLKVVPSDYGVWI